jgi:hypothetical protein
MSVFARIDGGTVVELFTPPDGFTLEESVVAALVPTFALVPEGVSPEPGWSYDGTAFAAPPPPPPQTPAQIAALAYAAFVANGLSVTSTGSPALSGLYAIDDVSQTDIATEAQFISTFAEFTTGATTNLPWPMPNGAIMIFPTTTAFLSFAKVAAQAVAAAKFALAQSAAMPAATATIP